MKASKQTAKGDDERQREAARILERAASGSETIGSSGFARTASRIAGHLAASENPQDDRIEVLGKRIARVLAIIAFIGLAVYLVITYGTPRQ